MPRPTGYELYCYNRWGLGNNVSEDDKRSEWDKLSSKERDTYDNMNGRVKEYRAVQGSVSATFTHRTYATAPSSLQVLFKTFTGRDKLLRAIQYGLRAIRGVSQLLGTQFPPVLQQVMLRLIASRRTYRWLSFFPALVSLQAIFNGEETWAWGTAVHKKAMYASTKALILAWQNLDKVRWLCETRVLDFEKRFYWMRASFGLFTIACGLTAAHHAEEILFKKHDDLAKQTQSRKNLYKFLMHVLTFGHISSVIPSHDFVCGVLGMSTASMDLLDMWPSKK